MNLAQGFFANIPFTVILISVQEFFVCVIICPEMKTSASYTPVLSSDFYLIIPVNLFQ